MTTTRSVDIGSGIYTFTEASRILRSVAQDVTERQVRYWAKAGLALPIPVEDEDFSVLSFEDLVSLEIVRRFKSIGTPLQRVRRFDERLREQFDVDHPFAYKIFFTDGASVWAQIDDDPGSVLELVGRRPGHYAWKNVIATFAQQIRWADGQPAHAAGWHLTNWVEIDPLIQFGAPVVSGTRIPIRTIEANLQAGDPKEVADWYGLDVRAVLGVRDYLAFA